MATPITSGKGKQLASDSSADPQQPAKRTCDLDLNLLICTVCSKSFVPAYQCRNGHPACFRCIFRRCPECHGQEHVGSTRWTVIEIKPLQQVSCKHASNGCKKILYVTNRKEHENQCEYLPNLHCPVPGCTHEAGKFTLPVHLTDEHNVRTVELNMISRTVGIRMDPPERLVMVEGIRKEMFLLHHETKEPAQGEYFFSTSFEPEEMFFCTSFEVENRIYELKVSHGCPLWKQSYSMAGAKLEDIRRIDKCRNGPRLVYNPSCGRQPMDCGFDILLRVFPSVPES